MIQRPKKRDRRFARWLAVMIVAVGASAHPAPGGGSCPILPFSDDFETPGIYELFEEIVVPGCYGTGQASSERSTQVSQSGDHSLLVWSNASPATPPLNNHANVFKRLADCGTDGTFLYQASFQIDPATSGEVQTVEGSLQNTACTSGAATCSAADTITKIGAIQYQGNPFLSPPCRWAVWTGYPTPSWQIFLTDLCLEGGVWYTYDFDIEWDASAAGRYGTFQLRGDDLDVRLDLSSFIGGADHRGFDTAFVVTVEDQALDNGCDGEGDFDLRVFFDDLAVTPLTRARAVFSDGFESGDLSRWSSNVS